MFLFIYIHIDTSKYNWDCAYANECPLAVEDLDVGKLKIIAEGAIGLIRGHKSGRKNFGDSNPEWSC